MSMVDGDISCILLLKKKGNISTSTWILRSYFTLIVREFVVLSNRLSKMACDKLIPEFQTSAYGSIIGLHLGLFQWNKCFWSFLALVWWEQSHWHIHSNFHLSLYHLPAMSPPKLMPSHSAMSPPVTSASDISPRNIAILQHDFSPLNVWSNVSQLWHHVMAWYLLPQCYPFTVQLLPPSMSAIDTCTCNLCQWHLMVQSIAHHNVSTSTMLPFWSAMSPPF